MRRNKESCASSKGSSSETSHAGVRTSQSTQAEPARRARLSVSEVSALESASREPLASTLKKLACGLDSEVSDLLDGVVRVGPRGGDDRGHLEARRPRR